MKQHSSVDKVKVLEKYLPLAAAPVIAKWIDYFQCEFKISKSRDSKFGDYRHPFKDKGHRISVNCNLNPYAFLVTTVHEFAHLLTWNEYKRTAKPHGKEWKNNFRKMMRPFFERDIFPLDVKQAITLYLDNPAASSCSDLNLYRALKRYDPSNGLSTVESLPLNSKFFMKKDSRIFQKEHLVRKRYRCTEIKTGRVYLFNPMAEVCLIED